MWTQTNCSVDAHYNRFYVIIPSFVRLNGRGFIDFNSWFKLGFCLYSSLVWHHLCLHHFHPSIHQRFYQETLIIIYFQPLLIGWEGPQKNYSNTCQGDKSGWSFYSAKLLDLHGWTVSAISDWIPHFWILSWPLWNIVLCTDARVWA